ncbi:MAG TPA: hypothetical protein DCP03_00905 [Polaromonas sp.]|uniref:hypothetical protein n=1 Tax=Polaromonas sp. UBA4122 TaxID=1947074 RepID=UPI000EE4CCA8|nr:hypothetical protein [Polaromonas sp.]
MSRSLFEDAGCHRRDQINKFAGPVLLIALGQAPYIFCGEAFTISRKEFVCMNKHWLKSYPDGVAHETDPEQFRSLNQLREDSFKKKASQPFPVCLDRWMEAG